MNLGVAFASTAGAMADARKTLSAAVQNGEVGIWDDSDTRGHHGPLGAASVSIFRTTILMPMIHRGIVMESKKARPPSPLYVTAKLGITWHIWRSPTSSLCGFHPANGWLLKSESLDSEDQLCAKCEVAQTADIDTE